MAGDRLRESEHIRLMKRIHFLFIFNVYNFKPVNTVEQLQLKKNQSIKLKEKYLEISFYTISSLYTETNFP